jgi:hypothetical protein
VSALAERLKAIGLAHIAASLRARSACSRASAPSRRPALVPPLSRIVTVKGVRSDPV